MLESLEVDEVIHCGDIGSEAIVPLFANWPTHFVFGNVDYDRQQLRAAITAARQQCHETFGSIEREGIKIAFLHSDDTRRFEQEIAGGQWDLICYGHTHVAAQERRGKTLVLNPGAIYRANPHSLAIVDLPQVEATIVSL
jgi:putative phosphoesterase